MANTLGSIMLAVAVLSIRRVFLDAAGITFAAASLAALLLSRTVGVFGFTGHIWTSQAIKTLASEAGAVLALVIATAAQFNHARSQAAKAIAIPFTASDPRDRA